MNAQLALLFWSLVLFEVKHVLCDFVFQTAAQIRSKAIYGSRGGLIHSGSHGIASLPAILLLNHSMLVPAIVAGVVVHYRRLAEVAIIRAAG